MIIPTYVVCIVVPIFYILLPTLFALFIKNEKILKWTTVVFAVVFFAVLFMSTTFNVKFDATQVKVVFEYNGVSCGKTISWNLFSGGKKDIIVNICMLIPVGSIICAFGNKKFAKRLLLAFVIGLLIGLTIETYQFVLPVKRSVQLSDVLLNMFSVVIGTLYYHVIYTIKEKKKK